MHNIEHAPFTMAADTSPVKAPEPCVVINASFAFSLHSPLAPNATYRLCPDVLRGQLKVPPHACLREANVDCGGCDDHVCWRAGAVTWGEPNACN